VKILKRSPSRIGARRIQNPSLNSAHQLAEVIPSPHRQRAGTLQKRKSYECGARRAARSAAERELREEKRRLKKKKERGLEMAKENSPGTYGASRVRPVCFFFWVLFVVVSSVVVSRSRQVEIRGDFIG
jgi:hypothetical protein